MTMRNPNEFDDSQLDDVVFVLQKMHGGKYPNAESLKNHIKDLCRANIHFGEATYISTLGFDATGYFYCGDRNDWRFRISLNAWSIRNRLMILLDQSKPQVDKGV